MNNVDILLIGDTKQDSSFLDAQFFIEGYNKLLQLDVSGRSGRILVFTKSTRELTKTKIPMDIQIIFFELTLRKEKWLVVSIYKPPAQDATYFLGWLSQIIDFYSITHEKQFITSSLGLFKWPDSSHSLNEPNPIKRIVNKYKNHPNIKKIKSKYITVKPFSFQPATPKDVLNVISTLVDTKSSGGDIPLRVLKGNKIFPQVLF